MLERGEPCHVLDFDQTLVPTPELVYNHPDFFDLRLHRGDSFVPVLQRKGAESMDRFLNLFSPSQLEPRILRETENTHRLILTAGVSEIQKAKVARTGLGNNENLFVSEGAMKTQALIDYFNKKLANEGVLPSEVHVWEDRPEQINRQMLEIALQTRFALHHVKLSP